MLDVQNARRQSLRSYRRRAARDRCDHPTLLSHGDRARIFAHIVDISPLGCNIRAEGDFSRADRIRVLLPLLGDIHAHVAWSLAGCFGCWFDRPISDDSYPHLLAAMKLASTNVAAA